MVASPFSFAQFMQKRGAHTSPDDIRGFLAARKSAVSAVDQSKLNLDTKYPSPYSGVAAAPAPALPKEELVGVTASSGITAASTGVSAVSVPLVASQPSVSLATAAVTPGPVTQPPLVPSPSVAAHPSPPLASPLPSTATPVSASSTEPIIIPSAPGLTRSVTGATNTTFLPSHSTQVQYSSLFGPAQSQRFTKQPKPPVAQPSAPLFGESASTRSNKRVQWPSDRIGEEPDTLSENDMDDDAEPSDTESTVGVDSHDPLDDAVAALHLDSKRGFEALVTGLSRVYDAVGALHAAVSALSKDVSSIGGAVTALHTRRG